MSWLDANSDFPKDLLPFGVFHPGDDTPRIGVAVGDQVLELSSVLGDGGVSSIDATIATAPTLNPLIDAGPEVWLALRDELLALVSSNVAPPGAKTHRIENVVMLLPVDVADYVDFYSSIEHATNLGRIFRPDGEALMPNWRYLPIGYHGRAGTVVVSGTKIARPWGQRKAPADSAPTFGPSQRLDIELELGAVLRASRPGEPVSTSTAADHLFGLVMINDWSARDIQAWEYQPLGPLLGKSFATSMSPWVIPYLAVEPYLRAAPPQDPAPLGHLEEQQRRNLDTHLEVVLQTKDSDHEVVVSQTNSGLLYWTFAQQIAHLTSNGAHLRTGDLIATGTISGTTSDSVGSLIERTWNGRDPIEVGGVARTFLEDGDTVTLRGWLGGASGPSLGVCVGTIVAAQPTEP